MAMVAENSCAQHFCAGTIPCSANAFSKTIYSCPVRGTWVHVFLHAESDYRCLKARRAKLPLWNVRNVGQLFELAMTPCDPGLHFVFFGISAESYLTNVAFPGLESHFCFRHFGV